MTLTKTGYFGYAGGGKNGATVDAWLASRFTGAPAQDAAPPSGTADSGPVTTGTSYGGPGAYELTLPSIADYYIRVQYGGHAYWTELAAGSIAGDDSGWVDATLTGLYTALGSPSANPGYRRIGNVVHLRGGVLLNGAGGGSQAFVLPTGYRPVAPVTESIPAAGGTTGLAGRCSITTAGVVEPNWDQTAGITSLTFDGVTFLVD